MADDILFTIVYPQTAPRYLLTHAIDAKTIRKLVDKVDELRASLNLASPPKDDLASLSRQTSPLRFVRADLARRFTTENSKFGDPKMWETASGKDAALGSVFAHLTPIVEWAEQELALTLAELSIRTGRIERTVDTFRADPATRKETVCFEVADDVREAADRLRAAQRALLDKHQSRATAAVEESDRQDQREVGARTLLNADAERILRKKTTFRIKPPEES